MINQTKQLFETFYASTYHRARVVKDKAFKDVVGEEYEIMRKAFYNNLGLSAKKEKIGNYDADLVVRDKNGKIIIIEEDKGHYVDSCFFKRFLCNAAEVINQCIQNNEPVPYIVLSCPTKMGNYQKTYDYSSKLFRADIKKHMDLKIVYLPYCEHGRCDRKAYYKTTTNCFNISDTLIANQLNLVEKAKRGV